MKVKLLSYTKNPEETCVAAIRQCYSEIGASEIHKNITNSLKKRLLKQVITSGHTSTLEHAGFTFAIEGISRACTHQLVRHRIASYSQQSQRYVQAGKNFKYIIPPAIKNNVRALKIFKANIQLSKKAYDNLINLGIQREDARFILTNAAESKIVVTMNVRSLFNFFEKRLCHRAQWEIRKLAQLMLNEVKKAAPNIFQYIGPTCQTQKICWENKLSCGFYKSITGAELKSRC
ncbi:MAG: thymidylate synthase (FAD) [Candidatus Portnoybacteria bacterium CG23_combo_of_CG06-09_8_20_14_all_37_13]|uniref:Flavin-dependent thymidylate synthase n=1 Tax=Candidatus Portnoybacteria bacterium CG23_combo_of_CG06-09_8_20_14_all_37_13 TaxID=1974819 RepID=A0A2G9YDP3_9BACT|nr:MAG: thymidylate synthase (FAD) [Candidatus Portnoybacteria bacterium CG23_combo_of_CG06-09_8_20_14_all_37_13]